MQKRPIILRSLLIEATPYLSFVLVSRCEMIKNDPGPRLTCVLGYPHAVSREGETAHATPGRESIHNGWGEEQRQYDGERARQYDGERARQYERERAKIACGRDSKTT